MAEASWRELRNKTRVLLHRVEAGETITVTIDGRPVALLQPAGKRPRVMPHQADPGLAGERADLPPDTTDDVPLR